MNTVAIMMYNLQTIYQQSRLKVVDWLYTIF